MANDYVLQYLQMVLWLPLVPILELYLTAFDHLGLFACYQRCGLFASGLIDIFGFLLAVLNLLVDVLSHNCFIVGTYDLDFVVESEAFSATCVMGLIRPMQGVELIVTRDHLLQLILSHLVLALDDVFVFRALIRTFNHRVSSGRMLLV